MGVFKYLPDNLKLLWQKIFGNNILSMSQAGQDFWVWSEAFNEKRGGFFLDIGAHDGVTISNTYILEKKFGWKGICVEANPESFSCLVKNRKALCFNVCLDEKSGSVNFIKKGVMGGIVDEGTDNKSYDCENIIKMETEDLNSFLLKNNAPKKIDYLSIDIEGAEERVFRSFDFNKYIFSTITIERPSKNLRNNLEKNKYILIKEIPSLDCFYIHESHLEKYKHNILKFYNKKFIYKRIL